MKKARRITAYREGITWDAFLQIRTIARQEYKETTGEVFPEELGYGEDMSLLEYNSVKVAARDRYDELMNMVWKAYKPIEGAL